MPFKSPVHHPTGQTPALTPPSITIQQIPVSICARGWWQLTSLSKYYQTASFKTKHHTPFATFTLYRFFASIHNKHTGWKAAGKVLAATFVRIEHVIKQH